MHTLKKRLQLIIGVILLVGAIHVVIYLTYQSQKEYRDIVISLSQQQLLATAKSSAKNLEEFIRMQQNVLRSLATDPILHQIDSKTDYGQLEMRYRELEGEIGGFYIISPQGIVTHRFPHKRRVGKDFSAKPGVAAVLKTQKPYVSELFFSDSGKPCMTVLEPIFLEGRFVGILRALTYFESMQTRYIEPLKVGRGYAWVMDKSERVVMHHKRNLIGKTIEQFKGSYKLDSGWPALEKILKNMAALEEGTGEYRSVWRSAGDRAETRKLVAYAPIHLGHASWSVAVSMDYAEILDPIKKQARSTFGLAAFIILLFGIAGYIYYREQKQAAVLKAEANNLRKISETAQALRDSEEKLIRAQKMESLGLLAGGVAHDLNNVLSGISSYPELLLLNLPEDSELRKPLETIEDSGRKAAAIVQDLLTMARGAASAKEPLDLNSLVQAYLASPEFEKLAQYHPRVTVEASLDSRLFNIFGSHFHILKVIMNLVSNAAEAIEGHGRVTVTTANRRVDTPIHGYEEIDPGDYVVLSIADDGPGISPDDLEKIFEPFYTKKVMGRSGTGLGLSVVWNVLKDHNCHIDVASDKTGTTFKLYFPITRDQLSAQESATDMEAYRGHGETVLVVDDVATQREITCKMLETLGYATVAVSSGEKAVAYLQAQTVDLVVLDMLMEPGISGRETYVQIVKRHPDQKTVIVSGFSDTGDVAAAQALGAGKYVKKPFTLADIGLAVRGELEPGRQEYLIRNQSRPHAPRKAIRSRINRRHCRHGSLQGWPD